MKIRKHIQCPKCGQNNPVLFMPTRLTESIVINCDGEFDSGCGEDFVVMFTLKLEHQVAQITWKENPHVE